VELLEQILRKYVAEKTERVNRIELLKKELHPFDEEFRRRMERYFEEGNWENIPEEDRDVRLKWFGIFYRKATPGYFMVRIRVPNGRLTYEQAKVIALLSERFCRGEVEVTSRQQIQLRWIELSRLPEVLGALESVGLSTLQTGMDSVRNVTGDPLTGLAEDSLIDTLRLTQDITRIFLGRKKYADLPRKFNIAVLGSRTDSINAPFNDICLYLAEHNGRLGFNVYLGGKMGSGGPVRAIDANIFIEPYEAVDLCRSVLDIYSTFGNRENRNRNRLYFLLQEWGVDRFKREGIVPLRNGTFALLVPLPAGKIKARSFRTVAELSRRYGSREIRLSVYQNLYITNVPEENLPRLLEEEFFSEYPLTDASFTVHTVACAGSDTCTYGVIPNKADALRVARYLAERFSSEASFRDLGFVGTKTRWGEEVVLAVDIYAGGSSGREGMKIFQGLPLSAVERATEKLLRFYEENRQEGETFTHFVHRIGPDPLKALLMEEVGLSVGR